MFYSYYYFKFNFDKQALIIIFYEMFSTAQVAYRYHLAVGPVDGRLYISDPEKHQILRVKLPEETIDVKDNLEVVVGSGEKCLPGDKFSCGDGRLAKLARLAYPKGKLQNIIVKTIMLF